MGWASHPDTISVKLRLDREAGHDPVRAARVGVVRITVVAHIPEDRGGRSYWRTYPPPVRTKPQSTIRSINFNTTNIIMFIFYIGRNVNIVDI